MNAVETAIRSLLDDLVADDPVLATQLGLTAGLDRLPGWSVADIGRRRAMLHDHEARLLPLLAAPRVDDAVDAFAGLQVVRRALRALELTCAYRRHPAMYLDVVSGLYPPLVRELAPLDDRLEALAGRLSAVPRLLDEARDNLETGLSRAAVEAGIEYADGVLELAGPTMRSFAEASGRPGMLDGPSAQACAAIGSFRSYLTDDLLPTAAAACAAGPDVVADLLLWEHALGDTPDELAAYGREVLDESVSRMTELAHEMGHASTAEAVAAVVTQTPPADGLVAAYKHAVDAARAYIVEHDIVSLPDGEELTVIPTPPFLRSMVPFAAYDPPGPFDARQLGLYYVTPPADGLSGDELAEAMRNHPVASLPTTGVHEAYPGHHLQLVSANRAATLARRIAYIPMGAALLIEGWAFYCEELMEQQGFLADPAVRLMRLNDQAWRACRVIIDIELHLGRMELGEAVDLLVGKVHMGRREAELECRRYAEEPGQPLSYLIGRREVQRLAAVYRRERSASLKAFHDDLLAWGSLPPSVIAWGMGLGPRPRAARVSS